MNYIGSKNKLSGFLLESITKRIKEPVSDWIFCDLFAGTGIVGRTFSDAGVRQVLYNDKEYYSYTLNRGYSLFLNQYNKQKREDIVGKLNSLIGVEGKIYQNYCLGSGSQRCYFTDENGKKIDAIRQEIQSMLKTKILSEEEYWYYLMLLLEAADKVANTASVYGAFLKHCKKSAQKPLELKLIETKSRNNAKVYCEDANSLICKISGNVLYLDPPYNSREYGANYHLLNTIALYDDFIPKGKTGLREYGRSKYCKRSEVYQALDDLIKNANFEYICLSYNSEGLLVKDEISKIFEKYGEYSLDQVPYQRFKADNKRVAKSNSVIEYLYILRKEEKWILSAF